MNVNTIILGERYRIAASGNGRIKTVYDTATDRTLTLDGIAAFERLTMNRVKELFDTYGRGNPNGGGLFDNEGQTDA